MGTAEALAKRIEEAERKAREADQTLKQLKAKKAAIEARQRAIEAKRQQAAEDRRRFEVGGLVKQAGLLDLDRATLLGALLAEADRLRDPDYAARARAWGELELTPRGINIKSTAAAVNTVKIIHREMHRAPTP